MNKKGEKKSLTPGQIKRLERLFFTERFGRTERIKNYAEGCGVSATSIYRALLGNELHSEIIDRIIFSQKTHFQ